MTNLLLPIRISDPYNLNYYNSSKCKRVSQLYPFHDMLTKIPLTFATYGLGENESIKKPIFFVRSVLESLEERSHEKSKKDFDISKVTLLAYLLKNARFARTGWPQSYGNSSAHTQMLLRNY